MKHKIVAGIPTKNEGWILEKILKRLSTFCYKIIVNDDQSEDNTREICESFDKVEYHRRPPHDWRERQGGAQRQEILDNCYKHDPDYFLFVDADEVPTPDIIDFFENHIDEEVVLWTLPWYHLWGDENHYRIDDYYAGPSHIKWDPENGGQRKGFIVKNVRDFQLKYDAAQHRVRPSNQPINCPEPHSTTEKTRILHYGKLNPRFLSGQNFYERAMWDNFQRGADIQSTINMHQGANSIKTLKVRELKPEWKWKI